MKAYLMYKERDFDLDQPLPWNAPDLTQDLGLTGLFNAMANGDEFLLKVARTALLSSLSDPPTILYRQNILRDCLKHEALIRSLYRLAVEAIEKEKKSYWGWFTPRNPGGILHRALDALQVFIVLLRRLRRFADEQARNFAADGFVTLFATLQAELTEPYFERIEAHLRELKFRDGALISARLGKGNKGIDYFLRKSMEPKLNWLQRLFTPKSPYIYYLHPRDESGARALSELRDQGINLVAAALARSTEHILSFFQMLRTELAFYIACLNLHHRLAERRQTLCFPKPIAPPQRAHAARGLYDPSLALTSTARVIANDLEAKHKDLIIVTGANQGGKSTFLRSVGLAQLMMQAGMFVAARSFVAETCTGIFTHYKREEDATMNSGKLDEELSRMNAIVGNLHRGAMVLLNESFAATNGREGSEIATQIASALTESGIKVVFVTHLYGFAHGLYEQQLDTTLFLRAERAASGARTFRLVEAAPLQTSYGKDLYDRVFAATAMREPPSCAADDSSPMHRAQP
jgi:DNA mismatch repair ATPase MutS